MRVQRSTFYRYQHVTGPGCVLVSIRFGKAPSDGPVVIRMLASGRSDATITFDLENHLAEIVAGVAEANAELGGELEVEAVEVVPDDYPKKFQAQYAAREITRSVLRGEI